MRDNYRSIKLLKHPKFGRPDKQIQFLQSFNPVTIITRTHPKTYAVIFSFQTDKNFLHAIKGDSYYVHVCNAISLRW